MIRTYFQVAILCIMAAPVLGQVNSGLSSHPINSEGQARSFLLYLPDNYSEDPIPLVFSFHGSGGIPQNQVDTSGFNTLADRHGFAVVFPTGVFTNSVTTRSWNANLDAGVDDVQFVRDMIEDVASSVNIDRSRIYTSGFSGGGRMSSRLACELSDVLAAAAPVAGLQYPDGCTPSRAIPIISFHAIDDRVNQYEVGENSRPYWRMGVETALDKWRQANKCSLVNNDDNIAPGISYYSWNNCGNAAEINFYQTETGGHTWPGSSSGNAVQDIDASELIWEFFSHHSL
jgi:polyhydroxybutyrate depolymerase